MKRRDMLAALATAPTLATAWQPLLAEAGSGRFAPPATPMRLTRRLIRHLGAETRISVERSWEIRFAPLESGYSVAGRQISAEVTAPPSLDSLAAIERERIGEGMFPMSLDATGVIVGEKVLRADEKVDRAVAEAMRRLSAAGRDESEVRESQAFLRSLQAAGASVLSQWPRKLFRPPREPQMIERQIAMPSGETGRFRLLTVGRSDPVSGLMQSLERRIETSLGDSVRISEEAFTLAG